MSDESKTTADARLAEARADQVRLEIELGQKRFDLESKKIALELDEMKTRQRRAEAEAKKAISEYGSFVNADHQHRIYHFASGVDGPSTEKAMDTLSRWARANKEPITIRLTTPGGDVVHGLAFYDFILGLRKKDIHVTTVALGYAASMGGILLQAGDVRKMGPSAELLIHEISAGAVGNISEIIDRAEWLKRMNNKLFGILAERSTMSKTAVINRAKRRDWWIDAATAKKLGFCDSIGYE